MSIFLKRNAFNFFEAANFYPILFNIYSSRLKAILALLLIIRLIIPINEEKANNADNY